VQLFFFAKTSFKFVDSAPVEYFEPDKETIGAKFFAAEKTRVETTAGNIFFLQQNFSI